MATTNVSPNVAGTLAAGASKVIAAKGFPWLVGSIAVAYGWTFWQIKDSTQRPENDVLAFFGDHMWSIALITLALAFLILSGRRT